MCRWRENRTGATQHWHGVLRSMRGPRVARAAATSTLMGRSNNAMNLTALLGGLAYGSPRRLVPAIRRAPAP
jgi:hypothetical protein